ncbi:MAG: cytochrome c3 family protein [Spirochaetota bacterium]|nr:cytochrome c3 family protein [Spirochaetota bacterium]
MNKEAESKILLGVIIILAIVGIIGYSIGGSGSPIRVLFKTKGGPVVFDHKTHSEENGYGIKCDKCHHETEDEMVYNCRSCHKPGTEYDSICEDKAPHKQCIGANCIECHKEEGMESDNCKQCHM